MPQSFSSEVSDMHLAHNDSTEFKMAPKTYTIRIPDWYSDESGIRVSGIQMVTVILSKIVK